MVYYFTFGGDDPKQPYRGGWTEVHVNEQDRHEAEKVALMAFLAYHPRNEDGLLPFCMQYHEDVFWRSSMALDGNCGAYCHEVIKIEREVLG